MNVTITVLQFVVPSLLVLAGVLWTNRQSAKAAAVTAAAARAAEEKAAEVDGKKVDAEAYERARSFDREIVAGIKAELDRARDEIREVRAELNRERAENRELSKHVDRVGVENRELNRHVDKLERTVERLRSRLSAAGMDINGGG